MTEGDLWVSVTGTVHLEKCQAREPGLVIYWCGMASTPKHTRIGRRTPHFDPTKEPGRRNCDRCDRNQDLATRAAGLEPV